MIMSIASAILGIIVFFYLYWRRLKEDYISEQIFTSSFFILIGILICFLVSYQFFRVYWFWSSLVGGLIGLGISIWQFKFRFFESLEALIISVFPWISFIFLSDSVNTQSLISFIAFVVMVLLLGLFYFVDKQYKNFTWYRSGRIGLAGLITLGVFMLTRALVAFFLPTVVSFVDHFESIVSGVGAFVVFLLLFNLARSEV